MTDLSKLYDYDGGGLLCDEAIKALIKIEPFADKSPPGVISYGLTSYGYDMRVGYKFKVFTNCYGAVVDPKGIQANAFVDIDLTPTEHAWYRPDADSSPNYWFCHRCDHTGHWDKPPASKDLPCKAKPDHVIVPPNSFALAGSVERFEIPRNVLALCVGKSTLARCGIIVNVTPLEPCLSADTEALTDGGWILMSDVQVGDRLLTRRDDGVGEYQAVTAKQERQHQGHMLHFRGRSVDQLVTPDHRLFVLRRNSRQNTETAMLLPAAEVFGRHNYSFDRRVTWRGVSPPQQWIVGTSTFPVEPFLEFMGCWLGDGSAYHGTDGGYHVKLAVVTKEKKREYFGDVLYRLGISYSLHERGFQFFHKDLVTYLRQFGHAREKFIDRKILDLPPHCLRLLLKGLIASDGNAQTQTFTTSSWRLANDVQEVAFKAGLAATVRRVESKAFGQTLDGYKVRLCDVHMTPKMPPATHVQHDYNGPVYDVTVPNHVFFVRRNGKASWTGNCWTGHVTVEISNTTPLPCKIYANEGISQVLFFAAPVVCQVSYADKKGKYQGQTGLTLPKV